MNKNKDLAMAIFQGTIVTKEPLENRTIVTIAVDEMEFNLVAWDEEIRAKIDKYAIGQFVGFETKIRNHDFVNKKTNEKVYSFSFEILDCYYASSNFSATVSFIGRMTKAMEVKHFASTEDDYAVGTIAANIGQKATFVNFLHKNFNENIGLFCEDGLRVKCDGIVRRFSKGYSFYINSIAECPLKKEASV